MPPPARRALPSVRYSCLPVILRLAGRTRGSPWLRRLSKGEFVFQEGDSPEAIYLLSSGFVKLVKHSPRADPLIMEIIVPGGLFGLIAAMDKKPYPVSAQALQPVETYRVPVADFDALIKTDPAFAQETYRQLGLHVRHAQMMRSLAKESVTRRIAFLLGLLYESMGKELSVRREDIAEMVGSTPETAVRVLTEFRRKKWIASGWKWITVLNPAALSKLAENPTL